MLDHMQQRTGRNLLLSFGMGLACLVLATLVSGIPAFAQPDLSQVEIETQEVADGIHMLLGAGGNIGVSSGPDGVFLVDDQFAPLTDKIRQAVAGVSDGSIRFVLNTHWHFDHTGGNENFGDSGTLIVAHDNVRQRMSTDQFIASLDMKVEPSPKAALPVVTYADGVTFHLNGDEIHAFHVPPAHTDGDSVVHFRKANVVHMGDLFFHGSYPFIDLSSGGSFDGVIAAAEKVLGMVNDDTKIIPGHGPLATKADLAAYLGSLQKIRMAVLPLVKAGKTREEVVAANPLAKWNEALGQGFMNPETFTGIVYDSLKAAAN